MKIFLSITILLFAVGCNSAQKSVTVEHGPEHTVLKRNLVIDFCELCFVSEETDKNNYKKTTYINALGNAKLVVFSSDTMSEAGAKIVDDTLMVYGKDTLDLYKELLNFNESKDPKFKKSQNKVSINLDLDKGAWLFGEAAYYQIFAPTEWPRIRTKMLKLMQ